MFTEDIDPVVEREARIADKWYEARADREVFQQETNAMMTADYLLLLQTLCSDQLFGQEAVEWAVMTGRIKLTYDREKDLRTIMGEPGQPETGQYDAICAAYRAECRANEAALMGSYETSGLLEEINRSVPLAKAA